MWSPAGPVREGSFSTPAARMTGVASRNENRAASRCRESAGQGTVTLIEICSGAVDCGAMAMDQRWGVVFQAAASSAVTSRQTAKRSSISVRHWVALSRCLRGRKCAEMALKADRNRWACRTDLKRFIARSRCRVR